MTFVLLAPGNGEKWLSVPDASETEERAFYFKFLDDITIQVVDSFRYFFGNNVRVPTQWKWVGKSVPVADSSVTTTDTDLDNSGIWISGPYPDQIEKYPQIIIEDVAGNINDLWLGQRQGKLYVPNPQFGTGFVPPDPNNPVQQYNEVGERVGGKLTLTVTLDVKAYQPRELNMITDLVIYGMVWPIRNYLYTKALNWMPNQGIISPLSIENRTATQPIYERKFTFGLQTEWYDDFYYPNIKVDDILPTPNKGGVPTLPYP